MVHDLSAGSDGGARAVARRCAAPREAPRKVLGFKS